MWRSGSNQSRKCFTKQEKSKLMGEWRNVEGMTTLGERSNSPERGVCSVGRSLAATKKAKAFSPGFAILKLCLTHPLLGESMFGLPVKDAVVFSVRSHLFFGSPSFFCAFSWPACMMHKGPSYQLCKGWLFWRKWAGSQGSLLTHRTIYRGKLCSYITPALPGNVCHAKTMGMTPRRKPKCLPELQRSIFSGIGTKWIYFCLSKDFLSLWHLVY